ncbi:rho GTPase activation protein domain containing protein [Rhodotorula toruloides]|uniref:Rho GTPase activation protein domain containing protein n=1 Tax=Rhodotorula toruloides TaxID=5286 RepID=A0A511KFB5_RHOTO|nr:rho GTPase activation protein domain containing protein [Rhodotorula toruloides]
MDEVHSRLLREVNTYLDFFQRRQVGTSQEIEQDYLDALKKLSLKAQQGDRALDDDLQSQVPTSWRRAWLAVRNAVEDEARAHKGTADGLDRLVKTLSTLRDDRDRIRRRIREDLRSTANEYGEYKTVVQRLRKTYERKVEELQHHEEAETARDQDPAIAGRGGKDDGWPPEHWLNPENGPVTSGRNRSDSAASSKAGGNASDIDSPPSSAVSPGLAPVFVSGATSSSSAAPSAYRDPPTGKQNVFEAIAKRDWSGDKHRVNSIVRAVGNLAKGADPATALGPSRTVRNKQYGSKLKREAEQADRDYRSGIFQLETLRLQKQRVQTSARESLKEFVNELASTFKTQLEKRASDEIVLGETHTAIASHLVPDIASIDAQHDAQTFFAGVQDPAPADLPVYYVNAFVGECKSLLFGVGLQDYHAKHPNMLVPLIVQRCIANIEATGLDQEGIYRVPGKLATIQQIVHRMEKGEEAFEFGPNDDPPAVAGVLKLYLRQLPVPLFPFTPNDRRAFAGEHTSSADTAIASLVRRIRRLSPPQQATLKALCQHLAKIVEHESVNKMSASNLALIFTSVIFGEDDVATLEAAMQGSKDNVMEILIRQQALLFRDLPIEPSSGVRSRHSSDHISGVRGAIDVASASSAKLSATTADDSRGKSASALSTHLTVPSETLEAPAGSSPAMRAGSVDSVYALYDQATTPGVLAPDSSPLSAHAPAMLPSGRDTPTIISSPNSRPVSASPSPLVSPPKLSPMTEHPQPFEDPLPPPHIPPAQQPHREHSFDEPEPPLSAALGRHIHTPE